MFQAVKEAQTFGQSLMKPGVTGESVHQAVIDFFRERGYESNTRGFVHNLGHGVGLEVHEMPVIGPGGPLLKLGQVVTVEPGLYYPGIGGVRLEDTGAIMSDGFQNFTRLSPRVHTMKDDVADNYREAGKIASKILAFGSKEVRPGARYLDIVEEIESLVLAEGAGLAFPLNVSLNEDAAHDTASPGDERTVRAGGSRQTRPRGTPRRVHCGHCDHDRSRFPRTPHRGVERSARECDCARPSRGHNR